MTKAPDNSHDLARMIKMPPNPPKKDKPKAGPKPPKVRIQRHQGR